MPDKIARVIVHLVSASVPDGLSDATRKLDKVGYALVRVITEDGVEGLGVTYHEVGGEATKKLIDTAIAPRLVGRDPFDNEVLWQEFFGYLRGVGRKGLSFAALSAVDIALWDLKGKILGLPLYKLFGGGRTEVPVYASGGWTSYTDDQLVEEALSMVDRGFTKIKLKVGVEGGTNPGRDVVRVRKLREAIGPDISLLLDANNCWDAATAARFANRIAEYDPYLLEEPVFADDIPGLARFKKSTDIPLGTGEHEYTRFGVRDLLLAEAADIVQADGARAGGFTEMLKIVALTQAWNVGFAPHAMENVHLHLVAAAHNGLFLERLLLFEDVTARVFADAPVPVNGYMSVPDKPGMGLDLDLDYVLANDEGADN
ncbi:mandelate racemase/muconate lactonizing enzyme family protein [Microbacterium enclense]|uniref:mandelate racemase/muconate lactonizing enzyme family protein n=1 Tax=Microbacterium enclense TaxID=993073 RepID=UPI003D75B0F7